MGERFYRLFAAFGCCCIYEFETGVRQGILPECDPGALGLPRHRDGPGTGESVRAGFDHAIRIAVEAGRPESVC
ncbi:hypothetical protein D3C84_1170770 [compost metagenome]